ncbi:MAG: sigma-70 family RNA polymerase sigma factor [Chloroflexi bacterium]|jgi:RNA polymerase sigma-70 factor (ECF subfamily)|nr:sigma-70 family RNA polymerase sigma factor [Chloroflexota bacterium]
MPSRTNEEWLAALRNKNTPQSNELHNAALADLRATIMNGLPHALQPWIQSSHPQFAALTEEVAQETLLKVLKNLASFEDRSQFTTWVHKIAAHVALTELRRRKWRDASLEEITANDDGEGNNENNTLLADSAQGPEHAIEKADLLMLVRRIITEELTERQRNALIAAAIQDVPIDDLAKRMKMERNALYKLLHDARSRLKKRLLSEGISVQDVFASVVA